MELCKLAGNHGKIITWQWCTNFSHVAITSPAARGNWHLCCIWKIISELSWRVVWKPADYFNQPFQTLRKVPLSEVWYYRACSCLWCGKIQHGLKHVTPCALAFYWTDYLGAVNQEMGALTSWSTFLWTRREIFVIFRIVNVPKSLLSSWRNSPNL